MSDITTNAYLADIYKFNIEIKNSMVDMTINNVISWDWLRMRLTKNELKGLADFIYHSLQMNVAEQVMVEDSEALRNLEKRNEYQS